MLLIVANKQRGGLSDTTQSRDESSYHSDTSVEEDEVSDDQTQTSTKDISDTSKAAGIGASSSALNAFSSKPESVKDSSPRSKLAAHTSDASCVTNKENVQPVETNTSDQPLENKKQAEDQQRRETKREQVLKDATQQHPKRKFDFKIPQSSVLESSATCSVKSKEASSLHDQAAKPSEAFEVADRTDRKNNRSVNMPNPERPSSRELRLGTAINAHRETRAQGNPRTSDVKKTSLGLWTHFNDTIRRGSKKFFNAGKHKVHTNQPGNVKQARNAVSVTNPPPDRGAHKKVPLWDVDARTDEDWFRRAQPQPLPQPPPSIWHVR